MHAYSDRLSHFNQDSLVLAIVLAIKVYKSDCEADVIQLASCLFLLLEALVGFHEATFH